MKKLSLITAIILTACAINAQIIHVPGDYTRIQDGINAASDGDTVLVANATYYENIRFFGKAITVASHFLLDNDTNHISNTIINGSKPAHPDSGSVVMFIDEEDLTSILIGFSITEGTGLVQESPMSGRSGGGIICYNSGANIVHNKIFNNEVNNDVIASGGGISVISFNDSKEVIIESNEIFNNLASTSLYNSFGGGISCATSAQILNNKISNNQCLSDKEAGIAYSGGLHIETVSAVDLVIVKNNEITGNELESYYCLGGGIYLIQSELLLSDNKINNNSTIGDVCYGSAILLDSIGGDIMIENNTISENTHETTNIGAATIMIRSILIPQSKFEIRNNLISYNSATGTGTNLWGTAIWLRDLGDFFVEINGNIIIGNEGYSGSGLWTRSSFNYRLTNNIFSANEVTNIGGAIWSGLKSREMEDIYFFKEKPSQNQVNLKNIATYRPLVANNTFVGNHSDDLGGAVYLTGNYDSLCPVFINNIFKDNTADGQDFEIHHSGAEELLISYNNIDPNKISGNWDGTGNVDGDPLFFDDPFKIDDSSPCFNTGIESVMYDGNLYASPGFDFESDPRPTYGGIDIGADEYFNVGIIPPVSKSEVSTILTYPNPFYHSISFELELIEKSKVTLSIYNQLGAKLETIIVGEREKGILQLDWDSGDLPSGVYFINLQTDKRTMTKKIIKK